MRSPQILEKQRITLQKSNDGINEIGEQNRECKNYNDGAGDIHDGQYHRE